MVKRGLIVFLMSLNIPLAQKLTLAADRAQIAMFHRHFCVSGDKDRSRHGPSPGRTAERSDKDGMKDESR